MSLSENNSSTTTSEFEDNLTVLRQTYFFSGLPLETLKIFAYLCTREKFKDGEYIFQQNEDDGQAFYVLQGKARLERRDNGETAELRECESGDFIGGLALLGDRPRLFFLKALTDTTCLVLNREKFTKTMEQFPDLMPKLIKAVIQRIDTWEERFLLHRSDQSDECMLNLGVSLL